MPGLTFENDRKASATKIIALPVTQVFKVLVNGVEDTSLRITAPSDGTTEVEITLRATSKV